MINKKLEKLVLCGFCEKPIHIDEFGGVQKEIGFFHKICFEKNEKEIQKINENKKLQAQTLRQM